MESNNGYIYIRSHVYYEIDNICKLGKTKNIPSRDSTYATGEYKRGYFKLVIKILSHDDTFIERLLQRYFKNYHLKIDGGSEFYSIHIINEIIPFLSKTNIKFKVLSQTEINNLIRTEQINLLINLLKKLIHNRRLTKRDQLQNEYVQDILLQLENFNKVLVKAPTGFGKTIIIYKTINKLQLKNILILTPRLNLNKQFIENKYTKHLIKKYNYYQYSINDNQERLIKNIYKSDQNNILISCYQSRISLIKNIRKYKLKFDLVIFDEAHFISGWIEKIKDDDNIEEKFLLNDTIYFSYRIFTTATPIDVMILNNNIFGNIVEKVKIHELVNDRILCNIETIIKKLDNKKHEYVDLSKIIIKSMIDYSKRKGIIYVNNCMNAENLYKLISMQSIIKPYLYISKDIDNIHSEIELYNFEQSTAISVIIAVGKISYGYDNEHVDFICFGDTRTSDIDIRQIIGRGLRWNKIDYPNKILHILVPCYKNELENYDDNKALNLYMNYIISEYGNDDISKIIINKSETTNEKEINGKKYIGEDIPIEIYNKWCTTGYNMYSKFMVFLKINNIYDEISYNKLKEKQDWMISLEQIKKKYPKFCLRHIHSNNINYYWNKEEALNAINFTKDILIKKIGKDNYSELTYDQLIKKYNLLDSKIPNIDFDIYYPDY